MTSDGTVDADTLDVHDAMTPQGEHNALDAPPADTDPATLADMLGTGATYRQIDYWTRTGRLAHADTTADAPFTGTGSGRRRRWTWREVRILQTAMRLIGAGFRSEVALDLGRDAVDKGINAHCSHGVWTFLRVVEAAPRPNGPIATMPHSEETP